MRNMGPERSPDTPHDQHLMNEAPDDHFAMENIAQLLLEGDRERAATKAAARYPFEIRPQHKRQYTDQQKIDTFLRDGFIDRYSGERLFNPGFLRLLHHLLPDQFPFHPHGKAGQCHDIFWDLLPSVDHATSIHRGGEDEASNWVTTSMKRNLAKGNWTIEELGWNLYPSGCSRDWDGLSDVFVQLVEKFDPDVAYIRTWCRITRVALASLT